MVFHGLDESLMAVDGRRRALQSLDFEDAATAVQLACDVGSHGIADGIVVGTHKGRVVRTVGLAVEEDDRDALAIGTVDGW